MRLRQGNEGEFLSWLEKLGLKDFLRHYPVRRLVEWGWLRPQSRVIFPESFFLEEEEPPSFGGHRRSDLKGEQLLWDSSWFVGEREPLWFLDPFFRPGDKEGQVLFGKDSAGALSAVPESFMHPDGVEVIPFVDYFFHWQAYALLDVIRYADRFGPVLVAPNLHERLAFIESCCVEIHDYWKPEEILVLPSRWGGLAESMTWLSHYRSYKEAFAFHAQVDGLFCQGALELAQFLGVTDEKLANAIKEKMLVLAQDWRRENDWYSPWIRDAYPYLQADIYDAVEWLCLLSGKTLEFYLDLWSYDTLGQRQWAELHAVLKFDFYSKRNSFLKVAPKYFQMYCKEFAEWAGYSGEKFVALVDRLRWNNEPFDSFIHAFWQMHEEMTFRLEPTDRLGFRDRRPLDEYLILALRAEQCLMYAIEKDAGSEGQPQSLQGYIVQLASRRLGQKAIEQLKKKFYIEKITKLHNVEKLPVAAIMVMDTGLPSHEEYLVKAFLCCDVARNNFAHHYRFDKEVRKSKESGYMLTGVLVTMLYLLVEDVR